MTETRGDAEPANILVVEDDENLRLGLCDNLRDEGYRVSEAATGPAGREAGLGGAYDVIILDIMLPGVDGYTICRDLRAAGVDAMILMLTARTLEDDLVLGLDAGADDFLPKPYRLRELLARVRALVRRRAAMVRGRDKTGTATADASLPGVAIDRAARTVAVGGGPVSLTRTEFDLLCHLLDHAGEALSRDAILDAVWGRDVVVDPRTVDNFVSNLKRKLAWTAGATWAIATVRGVGYRLEIGGR